MRKIQGRILSYRPDLYDHRDLIFSAPAAVTLADKIDLTSQAPTVMDQRQLNSCTWNAITCNLGFLQLQQLKSGKPGPEEYDRSKYVPPSRLFGYYNARLLEGSFSDTGAYLRDGIKTAHQTGVCSENLWPYLDGNVNVRPSETAYLQARQHRISQYLRIITLADMLACLNSGYPFVFGFSVYQSFYNVGSDGMVPMPQASERLLGGHAVTALGYDNSKKVFTIRNSWGSSWAANGNCYMPFQFVQNYGSDFWTIRL